MWILRVMLRGGGTVELLYKGRDFCIRDETALLTADVDTAVRLSDDYGHVFNGSSGEVAAFVRVDYDGEIAGMEAIARLKIDLNAKMQRAAAAKAGMLGGNGPIIQGDFRA